MNDLIKALVSTLLCALLGIAVAENSTALQSMSPDEHFASVTQLDTDSAPPARNAGIPDPAYAQFD